MRLRTKLTPYSNVSAERTRHGNVAFYYRVGKGPRRRIRGAPGDPIFNQDYRDAVAGEPLKRERTARTELVAASFYMEKCLGSARMRAAARGLEFSIDLDWCTEVIDRQRLCCALTNIPFDLRKPNAKRRAPYAPSLDRIDNAKGYTPDNTRIICLAMNIMLSDWGESVFRRIARNYAVHRRDVPAE